MQADIQRLKPARLVMTAPGDWRVLQAIKAVAEASGLPLDIREDRHFFSTRARVRSACQGPQVAAHGVLLPRAAQAPPRADAGRWQGDEPVGGQWNFDADNREAFGAAGPGAVPPRTSFEPDAITREVIALVNTRFADHPGRLDSFAWPVTRAQALQSLQAFIQQRLPLFGRYQDAMWPGDPWLYHAHLSAALNLKLLNPREVVAAAEAALPRRARAAGQRRRLHSPDPGLARVRARHLLDPDAGLPGAQRARRPGRTCPRGTGPAPPTWPACATRSRRRSTHGYANHIQRLMVTGLYALMLGVQPQQVHAWYLAVYVDAVEWVELPNTLGMSQYADGGVMGSKPYIATGKYIQRMSPHCKGCRYDPAQRSGDSACPFTTLYWDFLMRHEATLARNPRMALQVKNVARLTDAQKQAVQRTRGGDPSRRGRGDAWLSPLHEGSPESTPRRGSKSLLHCKRPTQRILEPWTSHLTRWCCSPASSLPSPSASTSSSRPSRSACRRSSPPC